MVIYEIETENNGHRLLILSELLKYGYKWHGEEGWSAQKIVRSYTLYPVIQVRVETKYLNGRQCVSGQNPIVTLYDVLGFKRIPSQDERR